MILDLLLKILRKLGGNKMAEAYLTESEARELVEEYMAHERPSASTQEILNSGAVPQLKGFYVKPGKVSDSIYGGTVKDKDKKYENPNLNTRDGTPLRIMVRTPGISTHDIVRGTIPFKDQILATNHNYMRRLLTPAIGTSQFDVPSLEDNAIVIAAENLSPIGIENVFRAYMAKTTTSTSLYVHYMNGEREFCGHRLPEGLFANCKLPYVMDTPSSKEEGHDRSLSIEEMIKEGRISMEDFLNVRNNGLVAFGMATADLRRKGIILVDTKLEHGRSVDGRIKGQDEYITMDSSRFWLVKEYEVLLDKFLRGEIKELDPASYSKELARGFSKGADGYTDDQRAQIAVRYIIGIQNLTEKRFVPDMRPREERVVFGLQRVVEELAA